MKQHIYKSSVYPKRNYKGHFEKNQSKCENTTYQGVWVSAKVVIHGKFVSWSAYVGKNKLLKFKSMTYVSTYKKTKKLLLKSEQKIF